MFFLFSRVLLNRNFFRFCTKRSKTRPLYCFWHGKDFWLLHLCAWSSSYLNAYLLNKSPKEVWKIHTKVVLDYGSQKVSLWSMQHRCWVISASVSEPPNSPRSWSIPRKSVFLLFFSKNFARGICANSPGKIFSRGMKTAVSGGNLPKNWPIPRKSAFFCFRFFLFFHLFFC